LQLQQLAQIPDMLGCSGARGIIIIIIIIAIRAAQGFGRRVIREGQRFRFELRFPCLLLLDRDARQAGAQDAGGDHGLDALGRVRPGETEESRP
jgi:hypothetical protein